MTSFFSSFRISLGIHLKIFNTFQSITAIVFDAQIVPSLANRRLCMWLLCPFEMTPFLLEHFLSDLIKMFQAHLVLFLAQVWNGSPLRGPLVSFQWGIVFRDPNLGAGGVHSCWAVLLNLFCGYICSFEKKKRFKKNFLWCACIFCYSENILVPFDIIIIICFIVYIRI